MKIIKIGECYLNLNSVTHVQFETSAQGTMCTVFLNCQVTDRSGCNGIQACKTFIGAAAAEVRRILDESLAVKPVTPVQ